MVKNFNIDLTEFQVTQLEFFADTIEDIVYSKEGIEKKLMILILNIESLLPNSKIFNYVKKYDEYKQMVKDIEAEIMNIEWSIESNSLESEVFNNIKEQLITKKGLKYGNI